MVSIPESSPRLPLTQRQREAAAAADLLAVLCAITTDGPIEPAKAERLRDWLFTHSSADLPAGANLTEIVVRILANGARRESDTIELYLAIERVLPVTERGFVREIQAMAEEAAEPVRDSGDQRITKASTGLRDWRLDPMTDPQRNFIKGLGGSIAASATKGEAALLIDQLLRKKPISSRQQVILQFWNRQPATDEGPREVAEWQERFYTEDPDRKAAWELFRQETMDNSQPGDPFQVPVGVGPTYLARVKPGRAESAAGSRPDSSGSNMHWLLWLAAAGAVAAIWFLVSRPQPKVVAPINPTVAPVAPPATIVTPSAPKADMLPEFGPMADLKSYARSMQFTGLLKVGGEHVVMINGARCRVGAKLGPAGDYTITEINPTSRSVVLTDRKGNAVRRLIE